MYYLVYTIQQYIKHSDLSRIDAKSSLLNYVSFPPFPCLFLKSDGELRELKDPERLLF